MLTLEVHSKVFQAGSPSEKKLLLNTRLEIVQGGRAQLEQAVLEVSYRGPIVQPLPAVTQLKAKYRDGQTFLSWREPHDVVGKDEPTFETFERAVLEARAKRKIVYRVYRHTDQITVTNLGEAKLICEVPETLSGWNLPEI